MCKRWQDNLLNSANKFSYFFFTLMIANACFYYEIPSKSLVFFEMHLVDGKTKDGVYVGLS